jgi:hypothetical protein
MTFFAGSGGAGLPRVDDVVGVRGGAILGGGTSLEVEESMTTTLPVPVCGGGNLVVGVRAAPPLEGKGGWAFLGGSDGLSGIILSG